MIPTKRLWAMLAIGILVAAAGALTGAVYLGLFFDLAVFIAAYVTLRLAPNANDLQLKRQFDPVLSVRVPNRINVRLVNDGLQDMQFVMRDEPPERCVAD